MARRGRGINAVVQDWAIHELSRNITKEWKDVARYLKLKDGDIDHISSDNEQNTREKIYQMLLSWKRRNGQEATYKVLAEALIKAGRKDLADDLRKNHGNSKLMYMVLCILPIAGYMCLSVASMSTFAWKDIKTSHFNLLNTKPKENSLQWFEFLDEDSVTIGGVMVKSNQIVHLSFVKDRDGVLLKCFDPHNPDKQYWQYVEKRVDRNVPVVISRRAIFYDGTFHVLFAAGNKVFIVHLHLAIDLFSKVGSVSVLTIDVVDPGTWISSIFGHQPTTEPCDEFLLTVSDSTKLFVYSALGNIKKIIETTDARSPQIYFASGAFCENNFAIVDSSREDITLISVEGNVKQFTSLKPPLSGYIPLDVICTGVRWLVLYLSDDNKLIWMVASYKTKHTEDFKINDQGTFGSDLNRPVSITHSHKNAYLTFANDTVRHLRFGTWRTTSAVEDKSN